VEEYLNWRISECQVSAKTRNEEARCIRFLFAEAVNRQYAERNPCLEIPNRKVVTKTPRFLTKRDVDLLLSHSSPSEQEYWEFLLHTGMRLGEMENLIWDCVDFRRRRIYIKVRDDWTPKNSQPRTIPMRRRVYEILKQRYDLRKNDQWVFATKPGNKLSHMRWKLQTCCRRAGIKTISPHVLRHTFASHLVMNGVDLSTVGSFLGHKDIRTTQIYAHLAESHRYRQIEKLGL